MPEGFSRAVIKRVASLGDARHRRLTGLFKAEGTKAVRDTIRSFELDAIYATDAWLSANGDMPGLDVARCVRVGRGDMQRISSLSTAPEVIAVYRIPPAVMPDAGWLCGRLCVALDGIADPGNMGTIMRTCDWFGVRDVLCSGDTVDIFNPKTVQATMGAIARVRVHYCDLPAVLSQMAEKVPVIGTFLHRADNLFSQGPLERGVVVIGNEGHGISPEVERAVNRRLYIPPYPPGEPAGESLNAAIAASIVLAHLRSGLLRG